MQRASELLTILLQRANIDLADPRAAVAENWRRIVGTDLASHASLADIDRGRMLVEVDHPAWLQLLQMRERQIISEVKRRYPQLGVTRMSSILGQGRPATHAPQAVTKSRPRPEPDPALSQALRELSARLHREEPSP